MKCSKCHYLSFDPEPRCRNCGHDLSADEADLALTRTDAASPLDDLTLRGTPMAETSREPDRTASPDAAGVGAGRLPSVGLGSRDAGAAASRRAPSPPAPVTTELPLFVRAKDVDVEAPLVEVPSAPRSPLAVRRKAPDSGPQQKAKAQAPAASRKLGPLDRDLLEDLQRIERTERREAAAQARAAMPAALDRAGAANRLAAAAVDALFLGAIGTTTLWLTLRWLDLPVSDARILPWLPSALFMLLVGAGYLVMFTVAGGQTLGKMVVGLRVVADDHGGDDSLTMKQAALRSLVAIPSVLAFGAGFVPALMGDERALHDRLAHTRVVRA